MATEFEITKRTYITKEFDYVQSFEVGEHIFMNYESAYLLNLAILSKKGIILSWSVIGEEGQLHVNNRDTNQIIPQMDKLGFTYSERDTNWFRDGMDAHFSKSIMVFIKN